MPSAGMPIASMMFSPAVSSPAVLMFFRRISLRNTLPNPYGRYM